MAQLLPTAIRASRRSGYVSVDAAEDPARYVQKLDEHGRSAFWQSIKLQSYQLLGLQPGNAVLDVGCGTGDDARALAAFVGPTGRVVGIDCSSTMIVEARRRSRGSNLPVDFLVSAAEELHFPAETFDACRVERVLQHVHCPGAAIAEMVRVTRGGGHIAAIDPDYGTLAIAGAEPGLTERILEHRCLHFASGRVGRDLAGLFIEAGLNRVRLSVKTLASAGIDRARYAELARLAADAEADGIITAVEAQDWLAQLATAAKRGSFRYWINIFLVTGCRAWQPLRRDDLYAG